MKAYRDEELSKEDLTQILHAFQASCIKMKSEDRDDALVSLSFSNHYYYHYSIL